MPDYTRSMARTQVNGFGAYHIRLDVDHPDFHRASRLVLACGGCEVVEAAGMVCRFITLVARDNALHLVRNKIGYTVASPFDGRPWWSGDPASRYLRISSQ
jgi:hypothetical protein